MTRWDSGRAEILLSPRSKLRELISFNHSDGGAHIGGDDKGDLGDGVVGHDGDHSGSDLSVVDNLRRLTRFAMASGREVSL